MFIVLSLAWGLAVFLLVQAALYALERTRRSPPELQRRLARLLGDLRRRVALLGRGLSPDQPVLRAPARVRAFILRDGGDLSAAVLGRLCAARQRVAAGAAVPSAAGRPRACVFGRFAAVVLGGLRAAVRVHHRRAGLPAATSSPATRSRSSFADGAIDALHAVAARSCCSASAASALAFLLTTVGVRVLDFCPTGRLPRLAAVADQEPDTMDRLLISAAHKSSGKTTVTLGLCARAGRARASRSSRSRKAPTTSTRCGWRAPAAAPASTSIPT